MAEQTLPEQIKFYPIPITVASDAYEVIDTDAFRACIPIAVNAMAPPQMMALLLKARLDRMNKLLSVFSITTSDSVIEPAQIAEIILPIAQELASITDALIVGIERISPKPAQ